MDMHLAVDVVTHVIDDFERRTRKLATPPSHSYSATQNIGDGCSEDEAHSVYANDDFWRFNSVRRTHTINYGAESRRILLQDRRNIGEVNTLPWKVSDLEDKLTNTVVNIVHDQKLLRDRRRCFPLLVILEQLSIDA